MSASTRTIQQPASHGSPLAAVAVGAAALLAVGAIAWGTLNLTAAKHVASPVQAPMVLDKGSRMDAAPQAAPVPIAGYWDKIAPKAAPATHPHGRPAYETPRVDPLRAAIATAIANGAPAWIFADNGASPAKPAQAALSTVGSDPLRAAIATAIANGAPAWIFADNGASPAKPAQAALSTVRSDPLSAAIATVIADGAPAWIFADNVVATPALSTVGSDHLSAAIATVIADGAPAWIFADNVVATRGAGPSAHHR